MYQMYTELGYKVGPRLRELAPAPVARGSQEAGFTQPRAHPIAHLCTVLYVPDEHWKQSRARAEMEENCAV